MQLRDGALQQKDRIWLFSFHQGGTGLESCRSLVSQSYFFAFQTVYKGIAVAVKRF